jgi:acetoin utilization deacetylase AcuC-like enzyme
VRIFHCDGFALPLPPGHRFPIRKYAMLRSRVEAAFGAAVLAVPGAASFDELAAVHDKTYVRRVMDGGLTAEENRRIGFPWSREMVERSRRSVGGTIAACRAAIADGVAVSLAGGTHHAARDHGKGFCVFNDAAVAARRMQAEGRARRILVVDCDVHQGDGTAAIFSGDDSVFTFSIHAGRNFPFTKAIGDLDVPLDDGTGDEAYLDALSWGLRRAVDVARADLAIYVSGADPFAGDRLGRLALTKDGLAARDRLVLETCRDDGLPVAVTMAGGYGREVEDTVDIHANTVRAAGAAARSV